MSLKVEEEVFLTAGYDTHVFRLLHMFCCAIGYDAELKFDQT